MKDIKLSVIIPSYNSSQTIAKCLRSLESQMSNEYVEVIVVDSSEDGTPDIVAKQFPKVVLYTFSERKFPGDARNFGISKAKGEILAFTDADCMVNQNWIDEIIKAHQAPYPLIGGAIDNGNPESYVGWSHYFCALSQWMPQSQTCLMAEIPTGCLSVKRWAFDKYGPFPERTFSEDVVFNWRVASDGHKPLFVPSIKVSHIQSSDWIRFLRKQLMYGRHYARARMAEQRFSTLRRITFVLASSLLPLLLFYRTSNRVFKTRIYLKQFVLSSPLVFVGLIAWSCGEFLGYLSKSKALVSSNKYI
jgi:glycosyltransferase involved in cell wall biosynthesis